MKTRGQGQARSCVNLAGHEQGHRSESIRVKRRTTGLLLACWAVLALGPAVVRAQQPGPPKPAPGQGDGTTPERQHRNAVLDRQGRPGSESGRRDPSGLAEIFRTQVPDRDVDVILARPTRHSVTVGVLAYAESEGYLEYGLKKGAYTNKTQKFRLGRERTTPIVIDSLQPDTRYSYRLLYRSAHSAQYKSAVEASFETARGPGSAFTFAVQSDSHLDQLSDPEVYRRTLLNANQAAPDFLVDLGDIFMPDRRHTVDYKTSVDQYLAQRYYLGLVGSSAFVFLTLGNHDGEAGFRYNGTPDNMSAWALATRKRYFPNPEPNHFYSGDASRDPVLGSFQDYYAWEWGNSLFIVLDPFWPTKERSKENVSWNWTVGEQQYKWLERTLETSKARFKFVFIHHLVGGNSVKDPNQWAAQRGGAEAAGFFEWGGKNENGSYGFKEHRPGWDMPIHALLVKNKVSVVFHGHDHFFAKEDLDGIVYQLVPQPSTSQIGALLSTMETGYPHGYVLSSPGFLRVDVSEGGATVNYIRTLLPGGETADRKNGQIAYSYAVQ